MGKLDRKGPFVTKPPDNGAMLAGLSKTEVTSKLSRKFREVVSSFDAEKIRERLLSPEQLEEEEISDQDDDIVQQAEMTDNRRYALDQSEMA